MDKKYKFTDDIKTLEDGTVLHRIEALRDLDVVRTPFGDNISVKKGEFGGYIEKEENLSHDGDCWVYEYALVYGNAKITGDSRIYMGTVYGNAQISGNVSILSGAEVFGDAKLSGCTSVRGDAKISGNTVMSDSSRVEHGASARKVRKYPENTTEKKYKLTDDVKTLEDGTVLHRIEALRDLGIVKKGQLGGYIEKEENLSHYGDCWVFEGASVYENAQITERAFVHGKSEVFGNAKISGRTRISGDAKISGDTVMSGNSKVEYRDFSSF